MPNKEEDDGGEEEEEEEEEELEEEVEVFLGISSSLPVQEADYFARFGGSSQTHECATCPKASGVVVEVCTVFAPFGELTSRQLTVCICQQCSSITVMRRQLQATSSQPTNSTLEVETKPLLFDDASATSLDELNALLAASSVKPKQHQKKKTKAPITTFLPPSLMVEFVLEPELADDDFSHEDLLLQRYNKEAAELGEEQVVLGTTTMVSPFSSESFYERLAREPRQLMRYAYGSVPLFPSAASKTRMGRGIPQCPNCGAARGFEFQLTPQALIHFQRFSNMPQVEWCTVLVFSCQDSCPGGHSEFVMVVGEET
ncbi:hypothetical protein BASA81_008094 [Batrachochytrium salamandrivorans]|nr:hypothetical protein BASA81_008094 [Batrachochytrium salamandrivorans]